MSIVCFTCIYVTAFTVSMERIPLLSVLFAAPSRLKKELEAETTKVTAQEKISSDLRYSPYARLT